MNKQSLDERIEEQFIKSVWEWQDGWRFCDTKFDNLSLKFQDIILGELGNHPFGNYVYSDDCACQIDGKERLEKDCGCECHAKSREFAKIVLPHIKQLLKDVIQEVLPEKKALTDDDTDAVAWREYVKHQAYSLADVDDAHGEVIDTINSNVESLLTGEKK